MKPIVNEAKRPRRRTLSLLGTTALAAGMVFSTACRQQMADQPYFRPYESTELFADKAASRDLVEGTVSRSAVTNAAFTTGKQGETTVDFAPFPITQEILLRGKQRYDINCAPCHGASGNGEGVVANYFIIKPPSYHDDKLMKAPIGHFVNVIANGYGSMYSYAAKVNPNDRWAIAAYIKALQLSQNANAADLPPAELAKLQGSAQ